MLGYQTLITTAFTGSRLIDTSGVLAYLNNKSRFNWGSAIQRIVYPYPYYYLYRGAKGPTISSEDEDVFRLINYDVSVFGSYPFSQVSRFQLSAGYRIQDFNHTHLPLASTIRRAPISSITRRSSRTTCPGPELRLR